MFDIKGYQRLEHKLNSIFKSRVNFYKIKDSPWSSVYHVIAGGNKYILKVGGKQLDHYGVRNEYNALRLLKKNKIKNIAQIAFFGQMASQDLLLTEFITPKGEFNIGDLGKIFGQIHSIKNKKTGRFYSDFSKKIICYLNTELKNMKHIYYKQNRISNLRVIKDLELLLEGINSFILSKRLWFNENKFSFINMDNSDNIIYNNKNIFIVDWHLARFGDPAWDLSRLFCYYKFDAQKIKYFLKNYLETVRREKFLIERIKIYNLINKIINIFYYYSDGRDLVKYSINPLTKGDPFEKKILAKALNQKISGLISEINIELGYLK